LTYIRDVPTTSEDTLARDAFLDLVRLHELLTAKLAALFAEHSITSAWFNVLRIVLGGPKEGVPCQYVGDRLLHRVPDVTRLLDRMEAAGLVTRERSESDRRVVLVKVTPKGRRVADDLRAPVLAEHNRHFAHMSRTALEQLSRRLREALAGHH
jgi:DNA-binding MarR family transcriptional regulator